MALIQLFRLEDKEERTGVYHSSKAREVFFDYYGGTAATSRHPAPYDDSKLVDACEAKNVEAFDLQNGFYRFAFQSLEQLRGWFYSDVSLIDLGKRGIVLRVYNCDESSVFIGSTQCAFEHFFHHENCVAGTYELEKLVENCFDLARIS
jgi:hypothetical protein